MKEFFDNLRKQKALSKANLVIWLSPVFYQGKKNRGMQLLADLCKLDEALKREE